MAEVPVIDGYSDLVQVAKGGFGTVYRARQDRFGRTVALKVLNVADLDERGQQRFERECVAMGSLGWHPNVVAVFDSGITDDGHPWLSMEFLDGGSLGDRLRQGPLPWQEAVEAGVQVAGALDAAHAAGILHRDLKPENLLVGPYGEIKLGDFGIAAVEGAARTTTGHTSFTANHVAPEILRRHRPSVRSDLYGLASTLHTLIAGAPPFAGEPDEPLEAVITSVLTAVPPRLGEVPEALADLLVRTLSKDPARRPASAEQFGHALQDLQTETGQPITDLRLVPTPQVDAEIVAPTPGTDPRRAEDGPVSARGSRSDRLDPEPSRGDQRPTIDHREPEPSRGDQRPTIDLTPDSLDDPAVQSKLVSTQFTSTDMGPSSSSSSSPVGQPLRSRRPGVLSALGLGLLVLLGSTIFVLTHDDPSPGQGSTQTTTDTSGPVRAPELTETIQVGNNPTGVAANARAAWVTNQNDRTVSRIDPNTKEVTAVITVGNGPNSVAVTATDVWVTNLFDGTVSRIDPATNEVSDTIQVGVNPFSVAATSDAVWVANFLDGTVSRIDPATNEVTDTIQVGRLPTSVAATGTAVWVTNHDAGTVLRIDPATNEVTHTIQVGNNPFALAATDAAVWVTAYRLPEHDDSDEAPRTVLRIDPHTNEVTDTIDVGGESAAVATTATTVWVTEPDGSVSRIDPHTNEVTDTIHIGNNAAVVAATNAAVWVTNAQGGEVSLIDPGTT